MKHITLNVDGWDDAQRRSVYGTVAARHAATPRVLGLTNMTGIRGSADAIANVVELDAKRYSLDWKNQVIACVTDNPNVMKSVRRKLEVAHPHIITLPCFLHQLNTLIGKVVSYKPAKAASSKTTKVVTFFLSSHFWGSVLKDEAYGQGIRRGLKTNTESRWYALIKQCLSVDEHR